MSEHASLGKPLAVAVGVAAAVAAAGGALTDLGPWYVALAKPSWQPPDWLFGPAWTFIFACTAYAGAEAWRRSTHAAQRRRIAVLFAVNGVLNIGWSLLFFHLRQPAWALAEVVLLWLSIVALVVALAPVWRPAAWLLAPYLAWVTFAAALNAAIVRLNAG
jgi:tryptophan-rich sensory protein